MNKNCLWRPLALLLAVTAATAAWAASPANVVITYAHPEKFSHTSIGGYFTDFVIQDRTEIETANYFAQHMAPALAPTVAKYAPGCTLTLQFTDVNLGGRFEPWRGPKFEHIRFYRGSGRDPIVFRFNYTLTDSRGRVLLHGSTGASDASYVGFSPNPTIEDIQLKYDELYFEKQALIKWVKTNINTSSLQPTVNEKR